MLVRAGYCPLHSHGQVGDGHTHTHTHSHRTASPWEATGAPWDMTDRSFRARPPLQGPPLTQPHQITPPSYNQMRNSPNPTGWGSCSVFTPATTDTAGHCTGEAPPLAGSCPGQHGSVELLWPRKDVPRESHFLGSSLSLVSGAATLPKSKSPKPSRHWKGRFCPLLQDEEGNSPPHLTTKLPAVYLPTGPEHSHMPCVYRISKGIISKICIYQPQDRRLGHITPWICSVP